MSQTINDCLGEFASYLDSSTRLASITKAHYVAEVKLFAGYVGDCPVEELTPQQLLAWNNWLHKAGVVYSTANVKHAALRKFLDYLEEFREDEHAGRLLRALSRLAVPGERQPRRETRTLSEYDFHRLCATAGNHPITGGRDMTMVEFLWDTGVRRAELADLRNEDLDMDGRVAVVVGKGSKERTVVFSERCRDGLALWAQLKEESWPQLEGVDNVFISLSGRPLTPNHVSIIIHGIGREARIPGGVWPHLFRHSAISRLLDQGMPLQDVLKFAGHAKPDTTMVYLHQDITHLRDAYDRATKAKKRE